MPRAVLVLLILGAVMLLLGGTAVIYTSYKMNQAMGKIMNDLGEKGSTAKSGGD
jgi:hypothetical protein